MQRPQLSRQHISSPLTVVDSDDEEGPAPSSAEIIAATSSAPDSLVDLFPSQVVEGWSIFENSTDSSSSETTLGLDTPQSPIWEDRLESFLRRRRAFSVDHEAAATPTKKRTKRAPARKTCAPGPPSAPAPKRALPEADKPRLARAQSWAGE